MKLNRRLFMTAAAATIAATALELSPAEAAACIPIGTVNIPQKNGIATGIHCYWNADALAKTAPTLAPITPQKSKANLEAVENYSPLTLMQNGSNFAAKQLPASRPALPNSAAISKNLVASAHKVWTTSYNAGQVGSVRVGAHDNIAALSVDSANPHQNYVEVVSRDQRVNASAENRRMVTGAIPMPEWFLKEPIRGGDKAVAVYDMSTGIWRSYFAFVQEAPAQTYTTVARVRVGSGSAAVPAVSKIFYASAPSVQPGAKTTLSPVSVDMNASDKNHANSRYPIARGARFSLVSNPDNAAQINAETGEISYTAPRHRMNQTVELSVRVEYPAVYRTSSAGYMLTNFFFGGVSGRGQYNYWLALKNGTSSVVGMANELTQIGVDELRSGRINHVISITAADYASEASFPAKGSDGRKGNGADFVRPGQRGYLPASFDVEAHLRSIGQSNDQLTRMILTAMKEYGFIICDRNAFNLAFNLEAPSSYARYARRGLNVYQADPEIKKIMDSSPRFGASFPWDKVQWYPASYVAF